MHLDHSSRMGAGTLSEEPSEGESIRKILKPIGFGGLGVFYVAFAGQGVTHLTYLGLTETEISVALLSGPICGAVLQPYFGSWSDGHHSPWGRRKPFIVIGAACLIISMLCLAWAQSIISVILPHKVSEEIRHTVLALFSMFSVFSMYATVQAVHVAMRVLVTDDCSPREQADANAWAGLYTSVGGVLGNFSAFVVSRSRDAGQAKGGTVLLDMSVFATICLILSLMISCFCASGEGRVAGRSSAVRLITTRGIKTQKREGIRRQLKLLNGISSQIRTICLVQFFSWLGWFPFYFYAVTYVNGLAEGQVSLATSSGSNKKRIWEESESESPRLGSLAFLTYSIVSLFTAILLPYLATADRLFRPAWMKKRGYIRSMFTMRHLWMASHAVFGFCMLGTFFVTSARETVLLFTLVGFSWAASNWIPYALLGAEIYQQPSDHPQGRYKEENNVDDNDHISTHAGLIFGVHGLSICLPQILMALFMGILSMFTGTKSALLRNVEIVWTFRAGGVFAFVAMFCTLWVQDPGDCRDSSDRMGDFREVVSQDY